MTAETAEQSPKGPEARRLAQLGLVLLLAVIVRAVYLVQYKAHAPYYSEMIVDSRYYDDWALRVLAGKGYGPMPFYMAPLYPYFLAAVYKVFGHGYTPVYVLQAVLGVFNTYLVYVLGRKLFGHASGLIAALLVTAYAPLVYLESKVMTETIAVALNLGAMLLLMRAVERPAPSRYLGAGILLGVSAVCRPSSLITVALFAGWLWLSGRRTPGLFARRLAPLLIGAVLAIAPVTARNYFVGHDLVLLTSNGGIVFAQANNENANGVSSAMAGFSASIMTQQEEEMAIAGRAAGRPVKPSESSAYWFRQGLGFVRERPGAFARLLGLKLLWSLHDLEARCSFNVYLEKTFVPVLRYLALPFSLLAGPALYGLVRGRKGGPREADLPALYILSVFLSLMVFSVSSRYRAPAAPALAVFAGFGIVHAVDELRRRRLREPVMLVGCIALFLAISAIPYPIARITAGGYNNLGAALARRGRVDAAIVQYRQALRVKPDHFSARRNLAGVLAGKGELSEAAEHYRAAVGIRPGDAASHFGLGAVLRGLGRLDEAVEELSEAIRLEPDNARAHAQLGAALAAKGDTDRAIRHYSAVVRLRPRDADARFDLGVLLGEKGRVDEEIDQYRAAIRLRPDFGEAHNNLAVALYYKGRYAEAQREARLARECGVPPAPDFLQALSRKLAAPD